MHSALHRPDLARQDLLHASMYRLAGWFVVCALVFVGFRQEAGAEPGFEKETLVPGAIGVRTDGRGNTWKLEENGSIGRVGTTMVNTGLALEINGEKFLAYQPMMTSDGEALVLQGRPIDSLPGLQVQRRIRIQQEKGGLRYAEMFFNGSTDTLSINVGLVTNFSGNYQSYLTDRGRTEPVLLGAEESGIIVLPGAAQSTRAFLFSLAGTDSGLKPTLSTRNRYAMTFQYPLTLAPGETAIILHEVAQTVIPQSFERRRLLSLFSPYALNSTVEDLPEDWVPYLQNVGRGKKGLPSGFQIQFGVESLGVEPREQDLLVIGNETRLLGTVESASLELKSAFGNTMLEIDEIYGLKGEKKSDLIRAFLRNGEILMGSLAADQLSMLPAGGGSIDIVPETLDRLLFAKKEQESAWPDGVSAIIETFEGERLALSADAGKTRLHFSTAWGRLKTSLEEIVWVGPGSQSAGFMEIVLKDGTRCFGRFEEAEFPFSSVRFGGISLPTNSIRSVFTPASNARDRWDVSMAVGSTIYLQGGQTLSGEPSSSVITIRTGGTMIDTDVSQIRSLSIVDATSSGGKKSLRIDRWDGGVVSGIAEEGLIPIRVGEALWRIPLRDIEKIEVTSPDLSTAVQEEIKNLILLLGSESWEERERASRDLSAYGYLAAPLLKKHLQVTDDPEVKRRLERILTDQE